MKKYNRRSPYSDHKSQTIEWLNHYEVVVRGYRGSWAIYTVSALIREIREPLCSGVKVFNCSRAFEANYRVINDRPPA